MTTNRILCVGAHPDDIEFGAGGILAKEASLGAKIKWLVVSRGEAGTSGTPETRTKETLSAAKLINAEVEFLDFGGDSHIFYSNQKAFEIARVIREWQAKIIIAPLPQENQHPDHAIVGKLTRDACRYARFGGIAELKKYKVHLVQSLFYFPSTPNLNSRPDVLLDVSSTLNIWKKMMSLHESQHQTRNYSEILLAIAKVFGMQIGTDYAWGLYKNDPLQVRSLQDILKTTTNF